MIIPFVVNLREDEPIVEKMLKDLNLSQEEDSWNYDSHHIISYRRKSNRYLEYNHQSNEKLEKLANLETCTSRRINGNRDCI